MAELVELVAMSDADKAAFRAVIDSAGGDYRSRNRLRLARINSSARQAANRNPRTAGLYTPAPTITDNGPNVPAQTSLNYPCLVGNTGLWHVVGGTMQASMGPKATTISDTVTSLATYSRFSAVVSSRYFTARLYPTSAPYRFIVNGQYVSMTGTSLSVTTGNASQYVLLDFGTRATRTITIECQQSSAAFFGGYVEATGAVAPVDRRGRVSAVFLSDSYVQGAISPADGSTDYNRADGVAVQMGDYMGLDMLASGSGGTGWNQSVTTVYRFDQRIAVGDLALGYQPPEIIFLAASVNDRLRDKTVVQANALAGFQSARAQFPGVPIIVFGNPKIPIGPQSGDPSLVTSESAVAAAVAAFADPLCAFVPVLSEPTGSWFAGTGRAGSTNGSGNNDWAIGPDGTHLTYEGADYMARRYAATALNALNDMLAA